MKPAIMDLGGHAPVIVCDDVDPAVTAATSVIGKSRNAGQVCVSPTRFFVQEAIYKKFTEAFAEKAAAMKVGNGLDPSSQIGPLANHRRVEAMEIFVADAKAKGARLLAGGERLGNRGYFFPLTVLADLPDDAKAMHQEPFGPLALINPVSSLDDAIEKANALPFGLAAYAFTKSARNADRLAEGVEVGNLSINNLVASLAETPFGGVKDSGYGREGGTEGLSHYTVVKNVSHLMMQSLRAKRDVFPRSTRRWRHRKRCDRIIPADGRRAEKIMDPQGVIRIAAALIRRADGRTLLVRKHNTETFMQPGGKIEAAEERRHCVGSCRRNSVFSLLRKN
jgi:delta 1-pyrroline-5-carboxylate dehydrogenase